MQSDRYSFCSDRYNHQLDYVYEYHKTPGAVQCSIDYRLPHETNMNRVPIETSIPFHSSVMQSTVHGQHRASEYSLALL